MTERLSALGAPVEADFQVAIALRGLSSEYDALRVAVVTKGSVTMSELREALRTEENRLHLSSGSVGAAGASVLSAVRGGSRAHVSDKSRMKGSCYGCGKRGHLHRVRQIRMYLHVSRSKVLSESIMSKRLNVMFLMMMIKM